MVLLPRQSGLFRPEYSEGTYRITGEVYPGNRLVEFAFGDAVAIADEEFVDPEVEKKCNNGSVLF